MTTEPRRPPRVDPLVGKTVAGRYEVLRLLGKGGMGSVYEVRHTRLKRNFALKTLAQTLVNDTEALARFQREADVVASLRHPNVVEIVDWEQLEDGTPCMVMEYLRGENLGARLRRLGPLPWADLGRIADEVLSALVVAHRAGIVHRDLKPDNIFLARDDAGDERAKLLDFGVSKIRHTESLVTADDRLIGTPAYMAPEQADGRVDQIGPHTDCWALGAILQEMATAHPAFTGPSTPALLYRICHGQPEVLLARRPDAPAQFVELVARALSHDPARRILDTSTLRARLREALIPVAPGLAATLRGLGPAADEAPAPAPGSELALQETLAAGAPSTLSRASGQVSLPGAAPASERRASRSWVPVAGTLALLAVAGGTVAVMRVQHPAGGDGSGERRAPSTEAVVQTQKTASESRPIVRPVEPRRVALSLAPASARVKLDGEPAPRDGVTLPLDGRRHQLRVSAPGYVDDVRDLDPATAPPAIAIALEAERAAASPHHARAHTPLPAPPPGAPPPPARPSLPSTLDP